ncbi:MAG: NUDIX hydrolase [Chitinispirillaceae bacterium]|nr:NUDIX hydrolase [Chitinispirillaceae bacterium]
MSTINNEKKVRHWLNTLKKSGTEVQAVQSVAEIRKKDRSLLFALLDTQTISPEGKPLPGIVFIRGHASVIVPCIRNRKTNEELFLIVKQRRIASGQLTIEFPAGMLDDSTDDPTGVAIRELQEETGLVISDNEIFPLNSEPLYSSPGASDEAIYFFGCIKEVSDEQFNGFKGKKCGNSDEKEYITVDLAPQDEIISNCTSIQVMAGLFLFNRFAQQSRSAQ